MDKTRGPESKTASFSDKDLTTTEEALLWLRSGISGLKRSLEDVDNELHQAREGLRRRRKGLKERAEEQAGLGESAERKQCPDETLAEQKLARQREQQLRWERALAEQTQMCTPSKLQKNNTSSIVVGPQEPGPSDIRLTSLAQPHFSPQISSGSNPQGQSNSNDNPFEASSHPHLTPDPPMTRVRAVSASSPSPGALSPHLLQPTQQQMEAHRQRYLRKHQVQEERKALSTLAYTDQQQSVHDNRNWRRRRALSHGSAPHQGKGEQTEFQQEEFKAGGNPGEEKEETHQQIPAAAASSLQLPQREREPTGSEEKECRVCRSGEEEGRPLFYPCRCKGSIKYVHQDCLMEWLKVSRQKEKCELCGEAFRFTPVYKDGAPPRLSPFQFVGCIIWNGLRWAPLVLRIVLMGLLWLVSLPILTMSVARFCFSPMDGGFPTTQDMLNSLPGWSPKAVLNDSFYGAGLCMAILTVTSSLVALLTLEGGDPFGALPPAAGAQQGQGQQNAERGRNNEQGQPGQQEAGLQADGQQPARGDGQDAPGNAAVAADPPPPAQGPNPGLANNPGGLNQQPGGGPENDPLLGFDEDVNMQELFGLEGSLIDAVLCVVQTFFFNIAFLLVFQMGPFQLGKWVWSAAEQRGYIGSFSELIMSFEDDLKQALAGEVAIDSLDSDIVAATDENASVEGSEAALMNEGEMAEMVQMIEDFAYLGLGYMVIVCGVMAATAVALSWHAATQSADVEGSHVPPAPLGLLQAMKRGIRGAWSWGKAAVNLGVRLLVLPMWVGVLADLFTLKVFAVSPNQRLAMLVEMPLITVGIHWLVGFLFIMAFSIFAIELRKILHRDILRGYLPVPHEEMGEAGALLGNLGLDDLVMGPLPEQQMNAAQNNANNLLQPQAQVAPRALQGSPQQSIAKLIVAFALPIPLLALVLFLPMTFGHAMLPYTGPLKLRFIEPFLEVQLPLELLLFHVALPVAIERLHLRSHCYYLLLAWVRGVGCLVGLEHWLLEAHFLQQRVPAGQPTQPNQQREEQNVNRAANQVAAPLPVDREGVRHLWARLTVVLMLAAVSVTLGATMILYIPLHAGRTVFGVVDLPIHNDFYAYCIGSLVCASAIALMKNVVRNILAAQEHLHAYTVLFQTVWTWVVVALKWAVLLFFWLVLTPLLIGTLFEVLIVTPMRVPIDEIPNFAPYSNWALGIVFLKIWLRLCLLGAFGETQWKRNLERILRNGIRGVEMRWTLKNVCVPLLNRLGEFLFVPYFLAEGLVPWAVVLPTIWQAYFRRYCFLGYLAVQVLIFSGRQFARLISYLHKRLLDDQYLVGIELNNLPSEAE